MRVPAHRAGRLAALMLALTAIALVLPGLGVPAARATTQPTVVSLTFDDGDVDQYQNAFPLLKQYGMHATFYIISGFVAAGYSGNMTRAELTDLYSAGNEIGGHTVLHPDLTQVSSGEAAREICQGRNTLLNWGFPVTDLAYPHGSYTAQVEQTAQHCGYNSARTLGNVSSPYGCLTQGSCPPAETIPPADLYATGAPRAIQDTWSLSDMEGEVTQTENNGGGWMALVFHHVCASGCGPYNVTPTVFGQLLQWLQGQQNVSVQTVSQVIGGSVKPQVSAQQVPPAAPGTNGTANASLENSDPYQAGVPACWTPNISGTNSASFAETSSAHAGSVAETVTVSSYTSGYARLISTQDLGDCAPSAVSGDAYVASAWYRSTTPAQFAFWYRDQDGGWHFWTSSPQFPAAASWTQATWATPAVPAGATALSFGLEIAAAGTLTTDDYWLSDSGSPSTGPAVSLTAPAAGATLKGHVALSANASSPVGIARVDFLVNGAVVASSASPPYKVTWDSSTVGDGPVRVTARATDTGVNQATTPGTSATVSNAGRRGGNMLANASVESVTGGGSVPDCWQEAGYGTNSYTWARSTNANGGNWSQSVTISSYTDGDRVLVTGQGAGACSPRVAAGRTYELGAWYTSDQPAHILVYYQNASGTWVYWTQSPLYPAAASWAQADWITPPVPTGARALSFGLEIGAVGTLSTDDYWLGAAGGRVGPVRLDLGGKCLNDVGNGSANGTLADIWTCNGSTAQGWAHFQDGSLRIHGKCLTVPGTTPANGAKVALEPCTGAGTQSWRLVYPRSVNPVAGPVRLTLLNAASGKCLADPGGSTTNGTRVAVWSCNGNRSQAWTLPAGPVASQIPGKCVDDSGNQTANGTKIVLWTCNGTAAQRWAARPDGTVRVHGKCLDVSRGGTSGGTPVDLWSCNGTQAQQWHLLLEGGGASLVNPVSGLCLTDPSDATANGAGLQIAICAGAHGQRWRVQ